MFANKSARLTEKIESDICAGFFDHMKQNKLDLRRVNVFVFLFVFHAGPLDHSNLEIVLNNNVEFACYADDTTMWVEIRRDYEYVRARYG